MVRRPSRRFRPRASKQASKVIPTSVPPSNFRIRASPRSSSFLEADSGSLPPATDSSLTFRQEEASLLLPPPALPLPSVRSKTELQQFANSCSGSSSAAAWRLRRVHDDQTARALGRVGPHPDGVTDDPSRDAQHRGNSKPITP